MKNAVLEADKKILIKEFTPSLPNEDECTIEIKAAGICSSDITRGFSKGAYFYPLVMGHEFSGVVKNTGDKIKKFKVGDRVTVFPLLPCQKCQRCQAQQYAQCEKYDYYGSRRNGGFSQQINIKEWNLLKVPDNVSFHSAALLEPSSVSLHAIKKANLLADSEPLQVCILGAGYLGLVAAEILSLKTRHHITLVDRNKFKLDLANKNVTVKKLDESYSTAEFSKDYNSKFDVVIEAVGIPETFVASLDLTKKGGTTVWMGNISGTLELSSAQVSQVLRKEITILGTWNSTYHPDQKCDWSEMIELFKNGLSIERFITTNISLDELPGTLEKLYQHKKRIAKFDTIKVIVEPNR